MPGMATRRPTKRRVWDPKLCAVFSETKGRFGGLSNMAPDFAMEVNGVWIRTVEALYQACRFPHLPDVQRAIVAEPSPMKAKWISRAHQAETRSNWMRQLRIPVMRWCLRVKLAHNVERFGALLRSTGNKDIVERSRDDDDWGAKETDGRLVGRNQLGLLLMELRTIVCETPEPQLRTVEPPAIHDFLLYGEPIATVVTRPLPPLEPVPPRPRGISVDQWVQQVRDSEPPHLWNGDLGEMFLRRINGPAPPTASAKQIAREVQRYMDLHPDANRFEAKRHVLARRRQRRRTP